MKPKTHTDIDKGCEKRPKVRKKKCRVCKSEFQPWNSLQFCCSPRCAIEYADNQAKKAQRKTTRAKKELLKTVKDLIKEVQPVFNKYIRARDMGEPCISCGRFDYEIEDKFTGGKWDCGHFLSVGSHPELRFEPLNAHKQCKSCNGGSGKYARKNHTVSQSYRINLIQRIGEAEVRKLEGPHKPKKYTVDDLREIKKDFKNRLKELE